MLPTVVGFSLISSAGYIFNDVRNAEEDRHHPRKRKRPVAAGAISEREAYLGFVLFALAGLGILAASYPATVGLNRVLVAGLLYFGVTLSYSSYFRKVAYLDVLVLGLGFVLRVAAGAFAIDLDPTWWLLGLTYALALLLGFGKRLGETQLAEKKQMTLGETRSSLIRYPAATLRNLVTLSGFGVMASYLAYCLLERSENPVFLLTLAPVVTGIFSYLRMAWRTDEVEVPERLFFSSRVLLGSVLLWLSMVMLIA